MTFRLQHFRHPVGWWRTEGREQTDLSPPYQRKGGQWSRQQQAYLIDSIINGFDLPKFYLADFSYFSSTLNMADRRFAVIDGRQRLEAISRFANGNLKLGNDFSLLDSPETNLRGLSFFDLAHRFPELRARFDDYQLDIVMVATDDESRINDMFIRLNSGTGLTGAQVRNAMGGEWPRVIREVADHEFFSNCIAFNTRQSQDLNVAAKLLMLEFRGSLQDTKRRQLDKFVKSEADIAHELMKAEVGAEAIHRASERTASILDRAARIFRVKDPLLRTQGPVTVYYWFVRSIAEEHDQTLRAFLVDFEERRLANREASRQYGLVGGQVDPELVAYDNYRRNANDARSIEGMVIVLQRRFSAWREASPLVVDG